MTIFRLLFLPGLGKKRDSFSMNVIEKGDHYPLTSTPVDYVDLEGSELDFD